jgi:predicted MFS family arabinose efflux permease
MRYVVSMTLLTLSVVPLLFASSMFSLAPLLVLSGLFVTPTFVLSYILIDATIPLGGGTEAFSWMTTAVGVGTAIGSTVGGTLADSRGTDAALLFGIAVSTFSPLVALTARKSLRAASAVGVAPPHRHA